MKFITTPFNPGGTLCELAQSLGRMLTHLQERLDVDSVRVGDTTKLDHDGTVTVGAFTMAEGAVADKVLTCDADGVASWGDAAVSVAGNDTEVQYNDGDTLAGDNALTWNKTTNVLSIDQSTFGTDVTIGDDLTVTDNASVGGDLTVSGEFKGARCCFDGWEDSTVSANRYLDLNNGTIMQSGRGYVMPHDGSLIAISGCGNITSNSASAEVHIAVRKNGTEIGSADYVTTQVNDTGDKAWSVTTSRPSVSFAKDDVLTLYLDITVAALVIDRPGGLFEVQFND